MSTTAKREFVLTRMIDAPREKVYQAWTDPIELAKWWGPRGFTTPVCEMDVRPGGNYLWVMRAPDGEDYPLKGKFREIDPPNKIVFTDDWTDHPEEWQKLLLAGLPEGERIRVNEAINTITFEERGGKTLLTIHTLFDTVAVRDAMVKMGMNDGWGQSLDKLEELLA